MKKRIIAGLAAAVAVLLLWGGYRAYRASRNLVTLEVRNALVSDVARKISWQTWERFLVHRELTNTVTFKVKDAPLDEVLNIIADQTECRWSTIYPLYSSSKSLTAFKKSVRGEVNPAENGWTNLNARGMFGGGFGGGFGGFGGGRGPMGGMGADNPPPETSKVSFNFSGQDLGIAITALTRFGRVQIVPEDGSGGNVVLNLKDVAVRKAVGMLASKVHRNWDQFYTLQPGFGGGRRGGPRGDRIAGDGPPDGGPRRFRERTNMFSMAETNLASADTNAPPEGRFRRVNEEEISNRLAQVLQTLPAEQRQQIEREMQQREEMRSMAPEERRQRFQEGGGGGGRPDMAQRMDGRMSRGVLNTTPEQRVNRDRRINEMRARFQQRQEQNPRRNQ